MKENRGRPSNAPPIKKRKYVLEYEDIRYHYDLDYFPNGPYLVENLDPTYDKLEKLYIRSLEETKIALKNPKV